MAAISTVMTRDVRTIEPATTLRQAAQAMADQDVGSLPVVDGDTLCGVVTDRDIVLRGVAQGTGGDGAVSDVMTPDVCTIGSDCDVDEAAKTMADRQIRRLYVVDDGKIVGVVALGDLAVDPQGEDAGAALKAISKSTATVD